MFVILYSEFLYPDPIRFPFFTQLSRHNFIILKTRSSQGQRKYLTKLFGTPHNIFSSYVNVDSISEKSNIKKSDSLVHSEKAKMIK